MNNDIQKDQCSVLSFAKSLMPTWDLKDWFLWPPDAFLLTSIIIKKTGCYRSYLNNNGQSKQIGNNYPNNWIAEIWLLATNIKLLNECKTENQNYQSYEETIKVHWENRKGQNDKRAAEDKSIAKSLDKIIESFTLQSISITMEHLKSLDNKETLEFCKTLLKIHSLADEACSGFGLLTGYTSPIRSESAIAIYLANLLLVSRGTLSCVPKFHGVIIPKMRTPQSGITPRSFSLHITYHNTEVEIMWRTIPWANIDENTLNILIIPWPTKVNENCFNCTPDTFEPVRFFKYSQSNEISCNLPNIVKTILKIDKEIGRVHIIAFPELALKQSEYYLLMHLLEKAREQEKDRLSHVPMVISGIRDGHPNNRKHNTTEPEPFSIDCNEVRLAVYFANKWYELSQSKHHRWKIDRNQIMQYNLEGRLPTVRNWYEYIEVDQRRLTFLAPTGWLALCPLICEDLAQLEPVSEVIRGVGPTLLVSLLFDGPQLKERWSARYASVFADDPGTAVLTVTSLGMAERSLALDKPKYSQTPIRSIALWKDQLKGWHQITLEKSNRDFQLFNDQEMAPNAVLLTLSADWMEEFTADGRSDNGHAAVFKFEGDRSILINEIDQEIEYDDNIEDKLIKGGWSEIRELSAITFALDSLIETKGENYDLIQSWLTNLDLNTNKLNKDESRNFNDIIHLMKNGLLTPSTSGIQINNKSWPSPSLIKAIEEVKKYKALTNVNSIGKSKGKVKNTKLFSFWNSLYEEAKEGLTNYEGLDEHQLTIETVSFNKERGNNCKIDIRDLKRIKKAVPLAILSSLHNRLESFRRINMQRKINDRIGASPEDAYKLLDDIETLIKTYA